MTPEERALLDGLFDRMRGVENQPRDAEAEALIARRTADAPHAAYTLSQTVLVQEHALQQAAARIQELEAQARNAQQAQPQSSGSFLGGLFGGGSAPRGTSVPTSGARSEAPMGLPQGYNSAQQGGFGQQPGYPQQPAGGPWGQQPQQFQQRPGMFGGGGGGGGFLQGALATAAGVAGGALLFQGIQGLMSHGTGPIADQASAAVGDLGAQAQNALGGAPDQMASNDISGWQNDNGDQQTASYDDGGDDGGDFGGDDSSWG
ncbi:ABC transporter substrate-binding protein [Azorhizobium oxalatiphilum]|uniref:ABC transporter substrate-binding protein n=1 Tax=Azorhizobium oxalatiphilum TaxID=980631 RepID=A0A917CB50_9HYPH|nr:DUF2076 domain-containing protein [Azorhizobium oxalatiphilum]GGF80800.1 ABC transporter substrate-binding protein [Azorhizobium oxalatiphilum]